ncbi:hypothetical protein QEH56_01760 [Pelagicoccus enzymogenes]|uniref:hypothetical protein n=1 Tax=Pelagicoccus enzymogenes TaxID=2773457 RepID=UPI00280D8416|nr:hypothetical protein [Pelagicoccus enzymogenes]MDQ8196850.1 hypothetical protein [Pelagicoccus enzymogenes]
MKEEEMEAFIDRLQSGSREARSPEGMDEEKLQMAALWDELADLGETPEQNRELVSDFQDKIDAYLSGWDAALRNGSSEPLERRGAASSWSAFFRYGLVAGVAAAMVFAGVVAQSFMARTDQLQAELRQTQETLALSLLEQSSAPKRLAGLATVSKIDQPSSRLRESVVRTFDSDSNLNVRLAAVTALRALPREEALAVLLERMESEGSPIVQIEILRQVLNLVGDGSDSVLVERIGKMNMEPRVRAFWEENNQSI